MKYILFTALATLSFYLLSCSCQLSGTADMKCEQPMVVKESK